MSTSPDDDTAVGQTLSSDIKPVNHRFSDDVKFLDHDYLIVLQTFSRRYLTMVDGKILVPIK